MLSMPDSRGRVFRHGFSLPNVFRTEKEYDEYISCIALNSPPHYVGLWDKKSIVKVLSRYGLSLIKILHEPLPDSWVRRYFQIMRYELRENKIASAFLADSLIAIYSYTLNFQRKVLRFANRRVRNLLTRYALQLFNRITPGHSIGIIMRKMGGEAKSG